MSVIVNYTFYDKNKFLYIMNTMSNLKTFKIMFLEVIILFKNLNGIAQKGVIKRTQ